MLVRGRGMVVVDSHVHYEPLAWPDQHTFLQSTQSNTPRIGAYTITLGFCCIMQVALCLYTNTLSACFQFDFYSLQISWIGNRDSVCMRLCQRVWSGRLCNRSRGFNCTFKFAHMHSLHPQCVYTHTKRGYIQTSPATCHAV